jgi:MFS superfamily sulfate permease-like transporter
LATSHPKKKARSPQTRAIGPQTLKNFRLAHGDAARAVAPSGMLALLIGGILVVAGLIRLGFIAEFLSRPVLLGYIMGVALTVIASQLEKIFGFKVEGSDFFTIAWNILTSLGSTQVVTFVLGVGLIALSVVLQRWSTAQRLRTRRRARAESGCEAGRRSRRELAQRLSGR